MANTHGELINGHEWSGGVPVGVHQPFDAEVAQSIPAAQDWAAANEATMNSAHGTLAETAGLGLAPESDRGPRGGA